VIARRSVSRPEEISYYIAYCPADAMLDELIRIAGSRWAVEECFQTAKQEGCRSFEGVWHECDLRVRDPARLRRVSYARSYGADADQRVS